MHFYTLGIAISYPSEDVLFIEKNIYDYLFDYELSIIAYYLKKDIPRDRIYHTHRKLFNNTSCPYRESILANYKFYAPRLHGISQCLTVSPNLAGSSDGLQSSTPSIISYGEGFLVNLRYVSYTIDGEGAYINKEQITTRNETIVLDAKFNIISRSFKPVRETKNLYKGVEDIRLFQYGDKIMYSGVGQPQDLPPDVTLQVTISQYDGHDWEPTYIPSPTGRAVERNWCLFHNNGQLSLVYEWYPLTIGVIEEGRFVTTNTIETPGFF